MNDTIEITEEEQDKGFTLIELLIVIVILGILATVTVFAVRGITDQGQDSACAADAKTFEVAVEAWHAMAPEGSVSNARVGTGAQPTQQNLVDTGLVRSTSTNVAISPTTGAVTGAGTCAAAPPTST